ncbi:hypothetical protein FB451DRAFT_1394084 [Mycena latifolia]|nr:hypothetical protein FB451DRAFT_1394084 [Mycena latifolia]
MPISSARDRFNSTIFNSFRSPAQSLAIPSLQMPPRSTAFSDSPDSIRHSLTTSRVLPLADLLFFSFLACRSSAVCCGSSAAYPEIDLPL